MKIKIRIKTPKGQAEEAEKKIRKMVLGSKKFSTTETYISPENDEIFWELEGSVKDVMDVANNVNKFHTFMKMVLGNPFVKNAMKKKLNQEEKENLEDMLVRQTHVEIIKDATAEEIIEQNKTWWQKMKETFRKKDNLPHPNDKT